MLISHAERRGIGIRRGGDVIAGENRLNIADAAQRYYALAILRGFHRVGLLELSAWARESGQNIY
ncbi:MAG: hypothetical protein WDN31_05090 [Hyphomicrobium sp.]